MKKSIHVILALVVGVMIGISSDAFAATKQYVQAYFSKYTFVVNGQEVELSADPLVYQDSTYLPLRAVLNSLGYNVGYKADTKTITADKSIESLVKDFEQTSMATNGSGGAAMTIDEIKDKLKIENYMLKSAKSMLASIGDSTEQADIDAKVQLETYISEHEAIIADLEAQLQK